MVILKQIFLLASIISTGWVLGNEKVLQDEDLKRIIDGNWDTEQAVLRKPESPSAHGQVFWKDEKSTPPSSLHHKTADNETLLDFDDIETTSPLTNLTSYKNMTFTSYKVMNIPRAINSSLLDPEDIDTAFSSPNALLGSPSFSPHSTLPRIFLSSPCPLPSTTTTPSPSCPNPFPHRFQPLSILIKPIGFVPKGSVIVIEVMAWELEGRDAVHVYAATILWSGGRGNGSFTRGLRLGMLHWGGGVGSGVNVLEIRCFEWLGGNGKGEGRGFVVDDLVVGFLDQGGGGGRGVDVRGRGEL